MTPSPANTPPAGRQTGKSSVPWIPILFPILVLLGTVLGGIWGKYAGHTTGSRFHGPGGAELSGPTMDLLRHLNSPVEIRFYSVLPPGSAPEALQELSRRVDGLLSEFQNANTNQIRVTRNISTSGSGADAASTDGIRPFNLNKGDACFLGVAVECGGRKESLPQIQPAWEPALEFDLARAIVQVTATPGPASAGASVPVAPEVTNAIVRLIPDLKGTSLEEGTRILREAAFEEFTAAGTEMENKLKAAQQKLSEVQTGGSEAEQQAAMKQLQEVQLEQGQKYKLIAARLQAELVLFQQMKTAASDAH